MTSKKKRASSALLLATLMAATAALSACGSNNGNNGNAANNGGTNNAPANNAATNAGSENEAESTNAATNETASAAADTSEFVKLTWYILAPLDPRPNETSVMKHLNEVLKEKLNVELTFKFIDAATYAQKIKVAAASGESFDIFTDINGMLGFAQNVSSGIALPLDDLISKYGQDIVKKVPEQAWNAVTTQGKKYGIANPSAWVTSYNIAYRKDIADKYNIDYDAIHTWKDLEPTLAMLKEKEPDLVPFMGNMNLPQTIDSISPMVGYSMTDGKWESAVNNTDWINLTKLKADWYQKGYLPKKVITDATAEFKTGRYAVTAYHVYDKSFVKPTTDLGTPMVQSLLDEKAVVTGSSIRTVVSYISKTSKNPERAMMMLDLLYADKQVFNEFCYGVEGQDWNYVSGQGTDNPTVKTQDQLGWAIWHPFIGSLWDQWPSNWNSQEVLDGLKGAIDKAEYSPFAGFVFDSTPVKKEMAQIDALQAETNSIYMSKDVDGKIKEFQDKANKAGLDKVLAEIDKQVTAWKAANGQ
ncbi:DUF3502 domain-containing protein [Paenibacillus sacheonensis]|uniref:DUF3502 domain-containing protein n=1 Tax=Paenibacillus sacheonensis TaxID=742054 RepID=A0A7X4YVD2_9BACL|nr:DUF3502 domain-containing protein [Paenibacillus sacheonensis]MBM7568019.1 putative aldouronate transport system substrate-binding protein [Paenibacillus sacheonensis]NBC73225.1 DUF3502 domain-containing protein [Paenibacillus sacheonensis]